MQLTTTTNCVWYNGKYINKKIIIPGIKSIHFVYKPLMTRRAINSEIQLPLIVCGTMENT